MTVQEKKYKVSKGEKPLQNSCHFVEALLKLACGSNAKTYDSEEVRVYWFSYDIIEITGTSLDKKKNPKEGIKLKNLLKLVREDNKDFPEAHIRNSIDLLKKVDCDKNEESSNTNQTYIIEEEELPTISQGIRKFKLKLKGKKKSLKENLKYLKECIKKQHSNFYYHTEDENAGDKNENTDPEKRRRKAADILRSFDCVNQESMSKPKIVKDKMGIFPTQVKEKELELWFRWRLTKCMGDFEKIKKITINIDFSIAHDFNQFWHKFGKYIGEKNNLNRKKVIDELVELCETQPVLIIINNVTNLYLKKQPLASSEENIFNFFYHLFNSFRSNKNKSYKSYLVVFLVEGKKKSQNINQEYSNQINNYSPKEDIIELQFTDFLQEDIESWLTENERKLGEEGFCANIEPGKMEYLLQQDSITLLDEVCQKVFNLEGILDVEHYWKNIA